MSDLKISLVHIKAERDSLQKEKFSIDLQYTTTKKHLERLTESMPKWWELISKFVLIIGREECITKWKSEAQSLRQVIEKLNSEINNYTQKVQNLMNVKSDLQQKLHIAKKVESSDSESDSSGNC